MRRHLGAALAAVAMLACAPAVTGCAHLPASIHAPAPIDQAKALYAAEASYRAAIAGVQTAADQGYLKGEGAADAHALVVKAYAALQAARAAYALGDAQTVQDRVAALTAFVTQINALLPAK
jgi:hypothetical protein